MKAGRVVLEQPEAQGGVGLTTPVVLIIFNRPELVQQVWQVLRTVRPSRLFIIADGPRLDHPEDVALCAACRAIVEQVDWPCQVKREYAAQNVTCGMRVATGLDWVFAQVEEAIILEDDILPDPSFFDFCQTLLVRYRNDEQTLGIGGYNLLGSWRAHEGSYFFHRHPVTWGWATWRRAWNCFDYSLDRYRTWNVQERLRASLSNAAIADYYWDLFQHFNPLLTDAWDIQWTLICHLLRMRWISPSINLVTNLGFEPNATHTAMADDLRGLIKRGRIALPLCTPGDSTFEQIDEQFDDWVFRLQTLNSYRDIRRVHLWQRALETNPDLGMPGVFRGGRPMLAPLGKPAELLTILDYVTPLMTDNPRLHRMKADLAALVAHP